MYLDFLEQNHFEFLWYCFCMCPQNLLNLMPNAIRFCVNHLSFMLVPPSIFTYAVVSGHCDVTITGFVTKLLWHSSASVLTAAKNTNSRFFTCPVFKFLG